MFTISRFTILSLWCNIYLVFWNSSLSINDATHFLRFLTPSLPLVTHFDKLANGLTSPFGRFSLPLSGWHHLWTAELLSCCWQLQNTGRQRSYMRLSSMVKHEFKSWIHIWHTYSMKRNILFIIPSYRKVCKQESSTYLIGREVLWKGHGIWNIWDKYIDNSWIPEGKLIWVEFIGVN